MRARITSRLLPGFLFTAQLCAGAVFESGGPRVDLIELFTSEGCSSCPPAERWLNDLRDDRGLWRRFVPVAFHVDYWNRLGWRDRFASPAYTARQRAYATAWRSRSVYTPCFVRNGREWPDRRIQEADAQPAGNLRVSVADSLAVEVVFSPGGKATDLFDLHLAWLGGAIESHVRAGENSGRKLRHDFVVLQLTTRRMKPHGSGGHVVVFEPPDDSSMPAKAAAVAAWITRSNAIEPIQATGGWLD